MKKTNGDIIILHEYQKTWSDDVRSWNMVQNKWTDRQADRQKWHIEVGAHLKTKENRTLSSLLLMTIDKKAF